MSSSWESQLTPQESKLFFKLFQTVGKSQPGIVNGQEAVMFFATSGVPNPILSEIWEEADRDQLGYLTPETFSIALKLIACAQHGKEAVDPVLATSVPLPQFDGVAASPAIVHASSPASTPITPAERDKYASIFKVHQTNGTIDAEAAKTVFLKSKLPMETLSQIWFLADVRQSGSLNQAEFTIAMHYIAKLMDGTLSALPDKLPPAVYQSANMALPMSSPAIQNTPLSAAAASPALQKMVMTPPQRARTIDSLGNLAFGSSVPESNWDVTAQEKAQFDAYFDKIDSAKSGVIQGKEAVEFFKNSRLPENDLAQIWDLSDIQHRGCLSRNEFAVAMHLIHKKLRGEGLPTTLPASLCPPQSSFSPQLPMQSSPAIHSQVRSPQPPQSRSLLDDNNDLLGDFGNDQVSNETNQVNLLQNQIQSLSMSSTEINSQKMSSEQALEQLLKQKKELEAQFTQVKMAHEQEVRDLNEVQEQVRREESEWNAIRTEYEAAQQQLSDLQNEVAQVNQTLANGRAETESLSRRIHEIQEETKEANNELDNLRNKTKQQNMMLDINRRQVTAAEQDRSLAKRNLEDYKATAAMNNDDDDYEEEKEEKDKSDGDVFSDNAGATPVEDNKPNTAVSTPALDNLFASPSAFGNPVTSPFAESASQTNSNTFDDVFGSALSTTAPTSTENAPASTTASDFDAIFGSMANPVNTTPSAAFDPVQWSSPTNSANSATKAFRSPPPPPPQSRHHRQASESANSVSSSVIGKKQRAPPPPPSAHIETNDEDFDSAFSGQLSEAKIVENTPKEDSKEEGKDSVKDDDFEAAFSGKLSEAKIVQSAVKEDDFDEFDDAFSNFEGKPAETKQEDPKKAEEPKKDWSGFDSFNFGEAPASESKPSNDDWDSIFGATNTASTTTKPAASGFDDAFSSFDDNFDSKPSIGLVGDKVEDLVKMGFSEKEAKDALNRYDQDLSKASNYLLDQGSKD